MSVFSMIWQMEIKYLPRRTASDKLLRDKTFEIVNNPKYDRYQCGLASMVDQGSEFYNRSMKLWLHDNGNEIYVIHNEEKSDVVEKFIRILKTKIYRRMTVVSNTIYYRLNEIVVKYNNTHHRTTHETD